MDMQLLARIREILGSKTPEKKPITRYRLGLMLNVPTPTLDHYEMKGKGLPFPLLCKLKTISGLSWNQIGKLIEDEFGKGEE